METFAKAIHGGQFPVSLLALTDRARNMFVTGTYGNTTTATPRALAVMVACLKNMTADVQASIQHRGQLLVTLLRAACCRSKVVCVRGAGLLIAIQLRPELDLLRVEAALRRNGLNVVHGGQNCIRLTPWFHMSAKEAMLIAAVVAKVLGRRTTAQCSHA